MFESHSRIAPELAPEDVEVDVLVAHLVAPGVDASDLERRLDQLEELKAVLLRAVEEVELVRLG